MNAFAEFADSTVSDARRKMLERADQQASRTAQLRGEREATPLGRKKKAEAGQMKIYRRARRDEWRAAVESDYGERLVALRRGLKAETKPAAFIALVTSSDWLPDAPRTTRLVAKGLVMKAVIVLREKAGFEFIDDAVFGQPPTVLEVCFAFIDGGPDATAAASGSSVSGSTAPLSEAAV